MDENYLDQLLKKVERRDEPIAEDEPVSDDRLLIEEPDYQKELLEMEEKLDSDAANIQDVAWSDAEIPTEGISELDELDRLADVDMNDLDFADIDFDDIDVTKLDYDELRSPLSQEDIQELKIDEHYLDEKTDEDLDWELQKLMQEPETTSRLQSGASEQDMNYDSDSETEMTDMDIDAMFKEVFGDEGPDIEALQEEEAQTKEAQDEAQLGEVQQQESIFDIPTTRADESAETNATAGANHTSADMDDLFAMLGLDPNTEMTASMKPVDEIPDFEIPPEMADIEDIRDIEKKKEKKKGFMDVLFGEDESDELTPEEEAALEEKKKKKAEAKLQKKQDNQQKRASQNEKKKKLQKEKAARLASKRAEEERILAAEGPEKKLNKPLCVIIVLFFLFIGGAVVLGTNVFDYTLVITKASGYFERQKYGMAYREILGVDVKEADKDLESRIYTVMYIERQYESYENYKKMNKPDYALHALLQGLAQYDTYYQEAKALNILDDYNYARNQILTALNTVYGMTQEDAIEVLGLSDQDYTEQIKLRSADIQFEEDVTQ